MSSSARAPVSVDGYHPPGHQGNHPSVWAPAAVRGDPKAGRVSAEVQTPGPPITPQPPGPGWTCSFATARPPTRQRTSRWKRRWPWACSSSPLLRIWQNESCVVIGRAQRAAREVNLAACAACGCRCCAAPAAAGPSSMTWAISTSAWPVPGRAPGARRRPGRPRRRGHHRARVNAPRRRARGVRRARQGVRPGQPRHQGRVAGARHPAGDHPGRADRRLPHARAGRAPSRRLAPQPGRLLRELGAAPAWPGRAPPCWRRRRAGTARSAGGRPAPRRSAGGGGCWRSATASTHGI